MTDRVPLPVPPIEQRSFLLACAAWQDSLLQSYRSIGLTLNSILLAVGVGVTGLAAMTTDTDVAIGSSAFAIVLAAFGVWSIRRFRNVVIARGRDVDFWHKEVISSENSLSENDRIFTRFKITQKLERDDSIHVADHVKVKALSPAEIDALLGKHMGHTRVFIDKTIGSGLTGMWLLLLAGNIGAAIAALS
jgi:hypothetical protein